MKKRIISEALHVVAEDTKLVRLAFLTSFCHSLIVMFLLTFYLNNMMVERFEKGIPLGDVMEFLVTGGIKGNFVTILIIGIIILLIGYVILYPIGQAALIHYLHDRKFSIRDALAKGMITFFPMFEFSALAGSFSVSSFIFIIIRLLMLDITDSIFIRIIIAILGISVLITSILRPYTKCIIILEGLPMYEATKRSAMYSIKNLGQTIQFVFLEFLLSIRFFVNILIIVGIPLGIMYLANLFHIIDSKTVGTIVIAVCVGLVLSMAYINSIIEAFFASYWYKIYNQIIDKDQE